MRGQHLWPNAASEFSPRRGDAQNARASVLWINAARNQSARLQTVRYLTRTRPVDPRQGSEAALVDVGEIVNTGEWGIFRIGDFLPLIDFRQMGGANLLEAPG